MTKETLLRKIMTMSPKRAYLFISTPILGAIAWSVFYYPLYTTYYDFDFWEHSALIREWTKNLWHPGNPHLAIDTGSPRYMPFFFVLSVSASIFDLDPIQALAIGGVLTMILFLCGVWLFFRLYFRDDWAPFVGLIVLLCGWGASWYWSNCYQLRCLFYVITYPSAFVFGLSLLSFWLATRILRQREKTPWGLLTLGLMSTLMLLCHPLTGAFAIGSLCLLALSEPNVSFFHRMGFIGVVLAGALAAELWPYFSVWRVMLGTSGGTGGGEAVSWINSGNIIADRYKKLYYEHPFYDPRQFFVALGPSLLGIPALIFMAYKRKHLFIILGFLSMSLPFVANLFFPIPLGHRSIFYVIFYLHLALIWGVLWMKSSIRKATDQRSFVTSTTIMKGVLFCFLSLSLLWNVGLVALEFGNYGLSSDLRFGTLKRYPIVNDMKHLSQFIPDGAIVLAPERLSWPLPTFAGKVVASFHLNPMVADHYQRRNDIQEFFQIETTQRTRLKILKRYKVTHILFEEKEIFRGLNPPQEVRDSLNDFGVVRDKIDDYVIIKVRDDL